MLWCRKRFRSVVGAAFLGSIFILAACGGGGGAATGSGGTNSGATPPLISSFTPTSAAVGATVQIEGLLFVSTAGQNTVRFNGVGATVLSATATEIIAQVPAGATSGPIQVSTAGGSATSTQVFNVIPTSPTPGVAWTTRLAAPHNAGRGLAYDGTKFVAVGSVIHTSLDLLRWDERVALLSMNAVAWNGQTFVAVGDSNRIYSSNDGLTWTARDGSLGAHLYGIASSGALWVAVGASGTVRTSPDGITWTTRASPISLGLTAVAWTGTQFVAVGEQGSVITSPDGVAWTARTSGTPDSFTAVGATSSLVIAATFPFPGNQSAILTSPDGVTWTQQPSGTSLGIFNSIINAGGRWVAVGSSNVVATSTNGTTWAATPASVGILDVVIYTGTQYVASGSSGSVYTSTDATSWTRRSADLSFAAATRSSADGRLVAVGSDVAVTSTDGGFTWSFGGLNSLVGNIFLDVEWFPAINAFAGLVTEGANQGVYTSTDGKAWTRIGAGPRLGKFGASPTLLVNAGSGGISTSPDGVNWTSRLTITGALQDAFWTGAQFIAIGNGGALYTSPDGVTWTQRTSNVTATLTGLAAAPSLLVVVGESGTIITSSDGITWTTRNSGTAATLQRVAWTGAEFVAVGSNGAALRSTDGVSWTLQPNPYTSVLFGSDPFDLKDVVWNGTSRLVVVGTRGLVATSP